MQTILNFKLESTNEKLTPRTGIAILGEYLKGMNLEELCNINLPKAKRNNGYTAFEFIYPLILLLHSGGRFPDEIREVKVDKAGNVLMKKPAIGLSYKDINKVVGKRVKKFVSSKRILKKSDIK